jgi:LuxR family transcriptional regulator, maltose regulon positive regulatory protein
VHHRTRLFKALDSAGAQPLSWITAPAGAGKTTLVVDYLQARELPCLWYQLDAGDGDIASFFYHLRLAAARLVPALAERLPLLTPEYAVGVETFSCNFFRALLEALPRPHALVFDNYQDLPPGAPLHRLLARTLDALPVGLRVVVASREAPPKDYARLRLQGRIGLLGWKDIRLTETESAAVAKLWAKDAARDARQLSALHRRAGGWLAGLLLLLEHAAEDDGPVLTGAPGTALLFDYFAAEVLRDLDPALRDFLLHTALLPVMTGQLADRLLECSGSARLLASLVERQLFTTRLTGHESGYTYHPLFRAFLLDRLEQTSSEDALNGMRKRAAALLAGTGQFEDAVALYRETEDWPAYVALLLEHAAALFEQGRHRQLLQWLGTIPEGVSAQMPWVAYWQGMCTLPTSPYDARRSFERAYGALREADDSIGQYLAWAGIADSFLYAWDDFGPALPWLDELDALQARNPELPSAVEVPVTAAALGLLLHARPQDPQVHRWAERAGRLLPGITQPVLKNALGHVLGTYHSWLTGDQYQMKFVAAELGRVDAAGTLGPLAAISARTFEGHLHSFSGDFATALERLEDARTLAGAAGIRIFDSLLAAQLVYAHVYSGNLAAAEEQLAVITATDSPRRLDRGHYHYLAGWVAWLRGDIEAAWRHAQAADRTVELHVPFTGQVARIVMAQLCRDRGEKDEAQTYLSHARSLAEGMGSNIGLFCCRCTEAWFALGDADSERALEPLRRAFAWGAASGTVVHPWWRADSMAALCVLALTHGIEPDYARRLIRLHRFQPPPGMVVPEDAWPWPLRIQALGGLALHIDGEPLAFGPKAPKKPLELLRRLLAEGGNAIDIALLAEDLWPDADGDFARHSLETTLYRLRKLLRHENALVVREGRLGLNPQLCWLDVAAVEGVLTQIGGAIEEGADERQAAALAERLFALYRGPLLPEVDEPWISKPRERLHARFLRSVTKLADYWRHASDPERARACCESALRVGADASSLRIVLDAIRAY